MKKILFLAIILAVMVAMPFAVAETNETEINETQEQEMEQEMNKNAGIGPNSPLYGLERSMERLRVAFTFRKAAKTELKSRYAEERLAEVYKMIKENRIENAERARKHYDEIMNDIGKDLKRMEVEGEEKEINETLNLMRKVENKQKIIEWINDNIKVKMRGNITEEERERIHNLITNSNNTANKLRIDIDDKVDKYKIALKARRNLTDDEVEQLMERARERVQERIQENQNEIGEKIRERVQEREEISIKKKNAEVYINKTENKTKITVVNKITNKTREITVTSGKDGN